jgi:hypothetical protein
LLARGRDKLHGLGEALRRRTLVSQAANCGYVKLNLRIHDRSWLWAPLALAARHQAGAGDRIR